MDLRRNERRCVFAYVDISHTGGNREIRSQLAVHSRYIGFKRGVRGATAQTSNLFEFFPALLTCLFVILLLAQENFGGNSRSPRGQECLVGLEHRLRELDGIWNTQYGRAVHG